MGAYLVENYLKKLDWRVYENSNTTYSLQGLNFYISSEITKEYWLTKVYNGEISKAHREGDLHIHDLQNLSVYCVGWDLYDLLTTGFKGAYGKAESKPPKHLSSALGQIVNFLYTLQGEAAGAQAFSNFDTLLAPFVRYDNLSYKQVKQAVQEFVFNLNVPTRVGFQTPFTNLSFDLKAESSPYADQYVVVGGEIKKERYRDFQREMDMINQAFWEVMSEGDASGRIFTFPIPTYNITQDFDWDNPAYEKLWEMTGKYGIPYFANFINSDLDPNDARSMCCRLRLDVRELKKRGGGLFGANPLTGSIGVVTINLPRVGYLSSNEEQFFDRLSSLLEIAKESLEIKRDLLEQLTEKGLYPYSKFYLRSIKAQAGEFWKNHFSTVGIIGMNEACLNLFGESIATEKGKTFAEKVLEFINNKLIKFQIETGNNYNLEATPAEGASYRLAKIDKSIYPDIVVANEEEYQNGAAPYYTNSTHLPVDYSDDPFSVLEHQDSLQTKYTGGTVIHFFLGEKISENSSVKQFVKTVCENYHLPYFTLTPTFSVCPEDGYIPGEHKECPHCGEETEVYSRIVGYFRPVKHWNDGKKEEFKNRKSYRVFPAAAT
ncbi:MAG: ribonucleoside triphosphate reductase [Persephonella sp.]|nr:ribonucleoside triphosphate reductase [Persephonella sp.]